jgi:iron complex outermembrane recepter protein
VVAFTIYNHMCKSPWIGACLSCLAAQLPAQHCHIALRGHVLEADTRAPLAYATVSVREAGKNAVADAKGEYILTDLCENTAYTISVDHVDCAHHTRVVRLLENTEIDFQLAHDNVLNEVLVAEKALAPQTMQAESAVERADLEAAKGINLGETLKRLPGVTTLNTGATVAKPVIQGLHSNRIAIVNNNVVLEGQQWGAEHAPEIDPFTADKISVVKGAAGIRYGVGAIAGAVVLEPAPLRDKTGFGGWFSFGGFSNGLGGVASGAVDWHVPGSSLALRLQGTAKRSGNLRAPDYWLGNTSAGELNASAAAAWKKGRWTHDLSASRFGQRLGILRAAHVGNRSDLEAAIKNPVPLNNRNEFDYRFDRPFQDVQHYTVKYRPVWRLSDQWKLSAQYSFQNNRRREFDVVRRSGSAADKPQVTFQVWTNTLDAALEHFPIRHWQGGAGVQAVQQLNYVSRGGLIPDYRLFGASFWATERWRRYPSPWEAEFGARYDYRRTRATTIGNFRGDLDTTVHFGNASAAGGLIYHFNRYFSARLHSGLAWRPPHVNELFAQGIHFSTGTFDIGNPALRPEQAWNSNFSVEYQKKRIEATLSVYRNAISDFLYLNPASETILTVRGAFPVYRYAQSDAVLQGLDAAFSIPFAPTWSFENRASLLRGRRFDRSGPETRRDWLPLMPADRFQYGIKWKAEGGRAKVEGKRPVGAGGETFVRVMATTTLRQRRIPEQGLLKAAPATFTLLNFDAAHTLAFKKQTLEIGLTIQNLGNARYREYLNFFRFYADEPGINVGVRAKWIFG